MKAGHCVGALSGSTGAGTNAEAPGKEQFFDISACELHCMLDLLIRQAPANSLEEQRMVLAGYMTPKYANRHEYFPRQSGPITVHICPSGC